MAREPCIMGPMSPKHDFETKAWTTAVESDSKITFDSFNSQANTTLSSTAKASVTSAEQVAGRIFPLAATT